VTRRRAAWAAAALLAAATVALYLVSRGKWSDPLIDSGREWIVPDGLSRGELLYKDVVYWFGPFTPYFQAAFFRVFGSGFATLVLAGAVSAAATLAVLFVVLRRVTDRGSAALWTALAIPALIFMPNAGGALLGMGYRIWHAAAFALGAVALAARPRRGREIWPSAAAGVCAGLAGLCRTEWGLAAIVATALASIVRSRLRKGGVFDAVIAALAFVGTFGIGLGAFVWSAGADAVLRDGPVLLAGLPPETRESLAILSGGLDWRGGLAELAYSAACGTGLVALALLASRPCGIDRRRWLAVLLGSVAVLAAAAALGGAGDAVSFSAAPLVSAAALLVALRRARGSRAAALAACGLLGLVLSYRRPFHIGDAPYVAPPLLFALVAAAGLTQLAVVLLRGREARRRASRIVRWGLAGIVAAAFVGRLWRYGSIDDVPVAGTSGMLSTRPELAAEVEGLAADLRAKTSGEDVLVVFPEGEILNFLSGRRNPVRHRLYLPGYVTSRNEAEILSELQRAAPAAVVFWRRPVSEYRRALFGEDYGVRIREWVEANYDPSPSTGPDRGHARFRLFLRRNPRPMR